MHNSVVFKVDIYIFVSHPAPPRDSETYVLSHFPPQKITTKKANFDATGLKFLSVSYYNEEKNFL